MNQIILQFQDLLARSGAPDWLQRPSSWLAVVCCIGIVALLVRMLFKRSREMQAPPLRFEANRARMPSRRTPASAPAPVPVRAVTPPARGADSAGGVFGAWTEALASQIPESEKEHKEFGAILKQA